MDCLNQNFKRIFFICLALILSSVVFAQENSGGVDQRKNKSNVYKPPKDNGFSWDKVAVGGNFGAQFGRQIFVNLSPRVSYAVIERLRVGIGGTYMYYRYKDDQVKFDEHLYGGSVFTQVTIWDNLFAHVEYEIISRDPLVYNLSTFTIENLGRRGVDGLFLGGGYGFRIGEAGVFNLMALFNVFQDEFSIYQNPIIRMGFAFGL